MNNRRLSRREFGRACAMAGLSAAMLSGAELNSAAPGLIPKSTKPAKRLFAVRAGELTTHAADLQLTLYCLQGLVNREQPVLFIVQDRYDELWLDWMRERGDVEQIEWLEVGDVFERFLRMASCLFITDPAIPATINAATMLAAVHGGLVATPATFQQYPLPAGAYPDSSKTGLDLRTMNWKKDIDVYRWVYKSIGDRLSQRAVAILDPYSSPLRDYLVEFQIPILWLSSPEDSSRNPQASFEEEKAFAQEILMKMPPNIPAFGWPGNALGREEGIGEWPGVRLLSECGKFEVCSGYDGYSPAVSNLSVHSGTTARFHQPAATPPKLDRSKIYCTFIRSDGDGLNFQRHYYRKLFDDRSHGAVPLGWEIGPTAVDLMPDILDYYYRHAKPGDYFVNALTGVGYIHEDNYADNYPADEKRKIWSDFLKLSEEYRARIDTGALTTFAEMTKDKLERFAEVPGISGIFANYGRTHATTDDNLLTELNSKPVFRAINTAPPNVTFTPSARRDAEYFVADQVKRWTPKERPAFLYVFLANWLTSIEMASHISQLLGPDYVFLRPDQLISLTKQVKSL
jgi:hypothetical protein